MKKNCPCKDCKVETLVTDSDDRSEYYMVEPALWGTVAEGVNWLCIACLEARLGRTLDGGDFTQCPVNDLEVDCSERYAWSYRSARLIARLAS